MNTPIWMFGSLRRYRSANQLVPARHLHCLERQLVEPCEALEDLAVQPRLAPGLEGVEGGRPVDDKRAELASRADLGEVRSRRRPGEERNGEREAGEGSWHHDLLS